MSDSTSKVARTAALDQVLAAIVDERARQDAQWGGTLHDDCHPVWDWFKFIGAQIEKAHRDNWPSGESSPRERLVKIAALAVAGLESIDRRGAFR